MVCIPVSIYLLFPCTVSGLASQTDQSQTSLHLATSVLAEKNNSLQFCESSSGSCQFMPALLLTHALPEGDSLMYTDSTVLIDTLNHP